MEASDKQFRKLMEEYKKDIEKFGFGDYAIDFSFMSAKKIKFICECMRRYNHGQHREFTKDWLL